MKITSGLALVIHGAKKKGKMQMAGDKNEKKTGMQKRRKKSARIEKEIDGLLFFISRENISDTPQSSSRLRRGNTPKKSLDNRQTKMHRFYLTLGLLLALYSDLSQSKREGRLLSLFNVITFRNEACTTTAASGGLTGTCLPMAECVSQGGAVSGNCAAGGRFS